MWTAGTVALVILAAVDAAYSGDWSRIGAISKDTELWLQSAVGVLAVWHILMGAAACIIANQNGRPALPATTKVTSRCLPLRHLRPWLDVVTCSMTCKTCMYMSSVS